VRRPGPNDWLAWPVPADEGRASRRRVAKHVWPQAQRSLRLDVGHASAVDNAWNRDAMTCALARRRASSGIRASENSIPAGAPPGFNDFVPFPDGTGGYYLEGTFELTILEATGIYQAFASGHNHMVDRLHQLADGQFR
jgi:hypothetical protein